MCRSIVIILLSIFSFIPGKAQVSTNFEQIFRYRSSQSYIPDISEVYGVAFRDINNDHLPDIYLIRYFGDNQLLVNNGAYRPFKDATAIADLSGNPRPKGVYKAELGETTYDLKFGTSIVDIENDGDGDVFISGWGISTALYRNDGNLNFKNITDRIDIFPPIHANTIVAADIDNDGLTDILFTDEHSNNRLLRNLDDGYFEDISVRSGLTENALSRGAAFCDLDNDGDQDLYITNWNSPDFLYINNGQGLFERSGLDLNSLTKPYKTGSVSFADLDNDYDFDIVVTRFDGSNIIYINTDPDSLHFTEHEFSNNSRSYGCVIADFNNDGLQDIYFSNFGQNHLILSPLSDISTTLVDSQDTNRSQSTGAAYADFDLDGDLDLYIANKNVNSIFYQNHTNNNSYIKFDLYGIQTNSDAIGARVAIYSPGHIDDPEHLLGVREVSGGSGLYSLNEPVLHFGLDTTEIVDAVISFPSGKVLTKNHLRSGHTYEIYEYDFPMRSILIFLRNLGKQMQQMVFWYQVFLTILFFILTFVFIRLGLRRYRWSPGTASAYLAGFFLLALIAITALSQLGLLTIFLVINILTIVFVAILVVNSERYYRLRKSREKYRSVLLNLSNQIVEIHDDIKLFATVIDNIHQNSDFDQIALYTINEDETKIKSYLPSGEQHSENSLSILPESDIFLEKLRSEKFLRILDHKELSGVFDFFQTQNIAAIERNNRIYGILVMGSSMPVTPLSKEDIDLFKVIGNQMAIAMENNEYIRKSTEMIKKLTAAEVREKYLNELETTNAELDRKNQALQKLYDELKETQTQLIHSEKMASLGQLVAGISHELNNPIGFIYSNAKQLKIYTGRIENFIKEYDQSAKNAENKKKQMENLLPDLNSLIHDTITGSQMIKEIVDNLRNFSHLDEAIWKKVDIHRGIESSIKIMLPQFRRQLEIHKDYQASGIISCNPGQLNQVFLNILANAAQAIENSGNIWISTRDEDDFLVIDIKDDGKGMPPKTLDKIFDPFFTTKDVGEGTGLGLSISYSIIQNHNGIISAKSKVNKGSIFTIKIPYTNPEH